MTVVQMHHKQATGHSQYHMLNILMKYDVHSAHTQMLKQQFCCGCLAFWLIQ